MSDDKKKAEEAKILQLKWNQFFKDALVNSYPFPSCAIQLEIWTREKEYIQQAAKTFKFEEVNGKRQPNVSYCLCKEERDKKTPQEWETLFRENLRSQLVAQMGEDRYNQWKVKLMGSATVSNAD